MNCVTKKLSLDKNIISIYLVLVPNLVKKTLTWFIKKRKFKKYKKRRKSNKFKQGVKIRKINQKNFGMVNSKNNRAILLRKEKFKKRI